MSARWLVERKRDDFDDVGAESYEVLVSGALKFYDGSIFAPKLAIIYAPGQWLTLTPGQDEA